MRRAFGCVQHLFSCATLNVGRIPPPRRMAARASPPVSRQVRAASQPRHAPARRKEPAVRRKETAVARTHSCKMRPTFARFPGPIERDPPPSLRGCAAPLQQRGNTPPKESPFPNVRNLTDTTYHGNHSQDTPQRLGYTSSRDAREPTGATPQSISDQRRRPLPL